MEDFLIKNAFPIVMFVGTVITMVTSVKFTQRNTAERAKANSEDLKNTKEELAELKTRVAVLEVSHNSTVKHMDEQLKLIQDQLNAIFKFMREGN